MPDMLYVILDLSLDDSGLIGTGVAWSWNVFRTTFKSLGKSYSSVVMSSAFDATGVLLGKGSKPVYDHQISTEWY